MELTCAAQPNPAQPGPPRSGPVRSCPALPESEPASLFGQGVRKQEKPANLSRPTKMEQPLQQPNVTQRPVRSWSWPSQQAGRRGERQPRAQRSICVLSAVQYPLPSPFLQSAGEPRELCFGTNALDTDSRRGRVYLAIPTCVVRINTATEFKSKAVGVNVSRRRFTRPCNAIDFYKHDILESVRIWLGPLPRSLAPPFPPTPSEKW